MTVETIRDGLVVRRPDWVDRRGTLVRLAPAARRVTDRIVENEDRLLESLDEELRALDGHRHKLLAALEGVKAAR